MIDVFVSYKAEDRARAKLLVDAFTASGLSVWWDLGLEGGASWRQTIQAHLDEAAAVVVLWSTRSVGPEGYFVQDEATRARRRGVYLPVAIDEVEAPLGFGQEHVLKLTRWRGNVRDPRFLDVLAAARALVELKPRPVPTARTRSLRGRRLAAPALVALALAVSAAAGFLVSRAPGTLFRSDPSPANSIAVLPFTNLSGDPSQEYFSDGLSDELIAALSHLSQLRVVARSSSFAFKGRREAATVIGAKLGVAWLLEGAVRREGVRIRVNAELSDARTGYQQWSESYDRDLKDVLAVQSGIAEAVAGALKVRLGGGDIAALSQGGTSDPRAYDAFLRGRAILREAGGEGDYQRALSEYQSAVSFDPRFAKAHAGLAVALLDMAGVATDAAQVRAAQQAALESARRAVALGPGVAASQVVFADALLAAQHDFRGAGEAFEKARSLGWGEANVVIDYGIFRCQVGDCSGALPALERGVALDPLGPLASRWLGSGLIGARRYQEAEAPLRRALALSPQAQTIHASLGDALLLQGKLAQAKLEYDREPLAWARLTGEAIVRRRLGDEAGARSALAALVAGFGDAAAYQQAQIHAQWGQPTAAFAALNVAIAGGDPGVLALKMDPMMDPLRNDPRFAPALRRAGEAS